MRTGAGVGGWSTVSADWSRGWWLELGESGLELVLEITVRSVMPPASLIIPALLDYRPE